MLSAPQREAAVGVPADEVVQVFTGDSLEEAMAYAVATLGPDLTVRRARKVRKGLQGLAGKDRYEVVALAPEPTGDADAVEDAFAALLEQAEQRETGPAPAAPAAPAVAPAATPSRPVRRPVPAADVPAPRAALEPPAPRTARARGTAPARQAAASKDAPRKAAARKDPARRAAPVVPAGWSRAALAAAGLPRPVLSALPAREPRDDAAWIAALARAIATVLPPARSVGRDHPVTVSGHGLAGVVGILEAARKGFPPGTISYDGRTAPATPTELALAVRAEVVR